MKDRIRENLEKVLFGYVVPMRIQKIVPRTAIFYIFFGLIATTVDLGIFYLAGVLFGFGYIISATIAFLCSSTTNFVSNKYLNYQNKSQKLALQYGVHFSVGLSTLLFTYVLLYFFIDILGQHPMLAKVISAFMLAFYSYFMHTHVTFSHNRFSE